ncbi:hypothetical protein MBANPS3_003986 [Mucor bainieri]
MLSFREELQFISRLRFLGRSDVRTTKHAWIEAGKSNQHIVNLEKLQQGLSTPVSGYQHVDFFNLILSTLSSAEEYRRSRVTMETALQDLSLNTNSKFTSEWVAKQIKDYIKGAGADSIKNAMQMTNDDGLDDLNALLEEMQLCNIAELMMLHVETNKVSLDKRIKCSAHDVDGLNVVSNIVNDIKAGCLNAIYAVVPHNVQQEQLQCRLCHILHRPKKNRYQSLLLEVL